MFVYIPPNSMDITQIRVYFFKIKFKNWLDSSYVCFSCSIAFSLCSEIQSLQDEIPELKNRLKKAEADLVKAVEGEKKASDEVSWLFVTFYYIVEIHSNTLLIKIFFLVFELGFSYGQYRSWKLLKPRKTTWKLLFLLKNLQGFVVCN